MRVQKQQSVPASCAVAAVLCLLWQMPGHMHQPACELCNNAFHSLCGSILTLRFCHSYSFLALPLLD
jgi:hypothetical protein